jgi:hypothetical protein
VSFISVLIWSPYFVINLLSLIKPTDKQMISIHVSMSALCFDLKIYWSPSYVIISNVYFSFIDLTEISLVIEDISDKDNIVESKII